MNGKTLALADLNKSIVDLDSSLEITFNGVRREFDEVNDDIDLLFSNFKNQKKSINELNLNLQRKINWLIAGLAFDTVMILVIFLYWVFK